MTTSARAARMPAVFVGHGSPMNAITDNAWSRAFVALGRALPRPRAAVVVSAHFYEDATLVTAEPRPKTIHDFGGFPQALYAIEYPAPGDPELARRIVDGLGAVGRRAELTDRWGLDHGTWSVLLHVWPDASVPVVQVSIDARAEPAEHVAIGAVLGTLRDDGVMVIGSGNVVHNLRHAISRLRSGDTSTPEWAHAFDARIAGALEARDVATLERAFATELGRMAHPSPDHYLPLLYVVGAMRDDDEVTYPITGFDLGSLSMRAVLLA